MKVGPDATHAEAESRSGSHTTPDERQFTEFTAIVRRVRASAQVNWWVVHEYVAPLLDQVKAFPLAGTVEWADLDDADPRKWAALFDAAQHWALRMENNQTALQQAGEEVSKAADWSAIAHALMAQRQWYAEHPWAARWSA